MKSALIALGGNRFNQGLPLLHTIKAALVGLQGLGFHVEKTSQMYQTPAFPAGNGPDYVNAAALLRVEKSVGAAEILQALLHIEMLHGRERVQRWGGRTLDLDLLALDQTILPDRATYLRWAGLTVAQAALQPPDQLILPHPRLHERAFVLVPLCDVAPDWLHPVTLKTAHQMRDALPQADLASVIALDP